MTNTSPLASPAAWNAVADGYTSEFLPLFCLYAEDALSCVDLAADARILDVAAGPGTLSLLAADKVAHVAAIDFSESMVAHFERRVAEAELKNVEVQRGDGQALPFAEASFDAAFSMFGLIFFPDRHAGFRELHRVLKPGCSAVVSSWTPVSEAPLLGALFEILGELFPDLAFGSGEPPLAEIESFRRELQEAGFVDVDIRTVKHRVEVPSVREFWASQEQASAPIALLRSKQTESDWQRVSDTVIERLETKFGAGALSLEWPARLGLGTKPLSERY